MGNQKAKNAKDAFLLKAFSKETISQSIGVLFVCMVLQRAIMLVRTFIFPNLLGPANYGAYNMASYFAGIVVPFAVLGIPAAYTRYIPEFEKEKVLGDVLKKTFLFLTGVNWAIMVFIMVFSPIIARLLFGAENAGEQKMLVILTGATIVPLALFQALTTAFNGMRVFRLSTVMSVARDTLGFIFGIVFVLLISRTAEVLLGSQILAYLIPLAMMGWILRKYIVVSGQGDDNAPPTPQLLKRLLRYSKWLAASPIILAMFRMTDRWMINKFVGLDSVGVYSVGSNITMPIYQMGIIVGNVLMPNLSSLWYAEKREEAIKMMELALKFSVFALLGVSIIVAAVKRPLIAFLFREEYMPAVGVIDFFLCFYIIRTIHWIVGSYSALIEKTVINFISSVAIFVSAVGFNLLLTPHFGIRGAAGAMILAAVVGLALLTAMNAKSGYKVPAVVIVVMLLPLVLVAGLMPTLLLFILMVLVSTYTDWVFSKDEKKRIAGLLGKFWSKLASAWAKLTFGGGES